MGEWGGGGFIIRRLGLDDVAFDADGAADDVVSDAHFGFGTGAIVRFHAEVVVVDVG